MKKSLFLAIFLAWISAVAGGALALANYVTAPVIATNAAKAEAENLVKIFTNGEVFSAVDYAPVKGNPIISVYKAGDTGYAYKLTVQGYSNPITYLIGVDVNGTIIGYEVLSIADTAGIGTKVVDEGFKGTVVGKAADEKIDTIGGATVSSKAVVNGITAVGEHFNANFK